MASFKYTEQFRHFEPCTVAHEQILWQIAEQVLDDDVQYFSCSNIFITMNWILSWGLQMQQ